MDGADIAGNSHDEEVADSGVEDVLDRGTGVGAAQDGGEWVLSRRCFGDPLAVQVGEPSPITCVAVANVVRAKAARTNTAHRLFNFVVSPIKSLSDLSSNPLAVPLSSSTVPDQFRGKQAVVGILYADGQTVMARACVS